jgi:hypothetical protein
MKIFSAEVKDGAVIADKGTVIGCPILGEGGDSAGYLVISGDDLVYLPKTSPDLKETLTLFSTTLSTIASGVLAENGGGAITSGSFASDLAKLKKSVDELKGKLK